MIRIKIIKESKNLLQELDYEEVKKRFQSKKFKKVVQRSAASGQRFGPATSYRFSIDMITGNLEAAVPKDIDKKYKAIALNWIISTVIKVGEFSSFYDWTPYKISESLETFFQIKQQKLDRFLNKKDINTISSFNELYDIVEKAKPRYKKHLATKVNKTQAEAGKKLIHSDNEWNVYIPETKAAACELGKGTDWCTAAPGLDYYEEYHKPEDPLIIFKNKKDPKKDAQFHFGTDQFMDVNDEPLPDLARVRLAMLLKNNKSIPDGALKEIRAVEYKKLENGGEFLLIKGIKRWYLNGKFHRVDGPAIEYADGTKQWRQNGKFHRVDGPAIEYANGSYEWWLKGKQHRVGGPAFSAPNGAKQWYLNGKYHRVDGPAEIRANGAKRWYQNGKYHRVDGPAIITRDGSKSWYLNDKLHRVDGPAIEFANGAKSWFLNDKRHRVDGPAIEYADGSKKWFLNGKLHRVDGPAVEDADGTKKWYLNGELHRVDGPAIEYANGDKEWYLNNVKYSRTTRDRPNHDDIYGSYASWLERAAALDKKSAPLREAKNLLKKYRLIGV